MTSWTCHGSREGRSNLFVRAVALSGYGQEDDIRRSYEAGFAAHLTKPASREAVVGAIASATKTTRS